jgi:hypothetical protein
MTQNIVHAYEDKWGAIIHRAGQYAEIRWYDTTRGMSGDDFQQFLTQFADVVAQHSCSAGLVDATSFKMNPENMHMGWRDVNIIPRYNAAGMKKFAFIMPEGMPAIGSEPAIEGPADFPTAYFGSRADALEWINI